MSFMFNPYPYSDPRAVNNIKVDKKYTDLIQDGSANSAAGIVKSAMDKNAKVIGVDGYTSAPFNELIAMLKQAAATQGLQVETFCVDSVYRDSDELETFFEEYLPDDKEKDPVLLYGKLYEDGFEKLMVKAKVEETLALMNESKSKPDTLLIVYGHGALMEKFRNACDITVFVDITPIKAVLNAKAGKTKNIGDKKARTFKHLMRRCYYVDFELSMSLRGELLNDGLDFYVQGDDPSNLQLVPMEALDAIFDSLTTYPLRCKPVYLEGIWGGHYVAKIRNLPKEMKNCAWVFDMIPLEVSVVTIQNDKKVEFPFFAFVQARGEKVMGEKAKKKFKGYFPIRFNYDDTWHSNGNMSIQVHPGEEYVVSNNNEKGRQDESYYVVQTDQEAKTYLGFNDDADFDEFMSEVKRAEKDGVGFDHDQYVNSVQSIPGRQFMIPSGTIHSSGRNQVVLEIGSLTVGSYTYKLYDYMRRDFDGSPRPIHSYHGEKVLKRERTEEWVLKNLVQQPRVIREGDGWKETIVGEHELLYFTLHNLHFNEKIEDDTQDVFHVLSLVNGEKVKIRSLNDPEKYFIQEYLDIVLVPHDFGPYEIVNLTTCPVTIHKTLLKENFENA